MSRFKSFQKKAVNTFYDNLKNSNNNKYLTTLPPINLTNLQKEINILKDEYGLVSKDTEIEGIIS